MLEEQSEEASQRRRCVQQEPEPGEEQACGGVQGAGEGGSKKIRDSATRGDRETPGCRLCRLQLPVGRRAARNSPEKLIQHSLGMATCGCPALDRRMSRVPMRTCDVQKRREPVPNPGQA